MNIRIFLRLAAVVLCLGLPLRAAAQAPRTAATRLTTVLVARTDTGVRVTLRATGPLATELIAAVGQVPPRIVVDLRDVLPGDAPPRTPGIDDLQAVRVSARASGAARVTLDLERALAYRVVPGTTPDTLMLDLQAGAAPERPATATESTAVSASPLVAAAAAAAAAASRAPAGGTTPAAAAPAAPVPARTSASAAAAIPRAFGRAAFFTHAARLAGPDTSRTYAEFASSFTYQLPDRGGNGLEYGIDLRHTAYTLDGRSPRVSIYGGYVGQRFAEGRMGVRGGHMWINDLGGLGSLAGGLLEARQPATQSTPLGRFRGAIFGGLEPDIYGAGYADQVRKYGGYVTLEGSRARRHVVGYVRVDHGDVVERSALSFTNYVPMGNVSVYQAAEYDLSPPGGVGTGGLTYFFANARATLGPRVEVLGTFNKGRSIDARGISDDLLLGRPVSARAIEGLLYRSLGGRVTVEIVPRVRAYVGYSRDRNNRDDRDTGRWLVGGYASNLFGTGLDLTVSDSRIQRPTGSYHSTYLSLGRQLGRRLYLTGDYTSSLALVRFVRGDGLVIELQPQTSRFGGSTMVSLTRNLSWLVTMEQTVDDVSELRLVTGLSIRFQ